MFSRMLVTVVLLFSALYSFGQGSNEEELRAVVIVARHGVRTPIENETRSGVFNAQPWPKWPTQPGMLTPHGVDALKRMGEFYQQRYAALLNGCNNAAVESTNTPRTIGSAKAVMSAVLPSCDIKVMADLTSDPPSIDKAKLTDAINGRMGNDPEWFTRAFGRPLAEMHDVLTKCDGCKQVPDFRAMMLEPGAQPQSMMQAQGSSRGALIPRDARKENAASLGADFAENFLLQYVEGMPMDQVGWGRVDRAKLDDLMEMNTRYHDFMLRTPYYAQQAAGPMAQKIAAFLQEGVKTPRLVYFSAHDANLTWLGGLLRMDWMVSDETFNATPPGSALVFELHHNSSTNADTVQVFFIAQTLEQIRNLTPLIGAEKPSIAPVYVPGCSDPGPKYACPLNEFVRVVDAVRR
ncbi:histidine-type phosphatase [Edaphobacter albus]|uniref:histidine-type phosphatase n=1 Tax=Edaphobacter sp. 4G125 TaxID=2763071 RepID=UPI0016489DC6|nr:histidine-type phosphatase [Edaphobacter sp. 4G125]QNI37032.1 histidine-type phosphatase [Edaphobacter sp. 4G125]